MRGTSSPYVKLIGGFGNAIEVKTPSGHGFLSLLIVSSAALAYELIRQACQTGHVQRMRKRTLTGLASIGLVATFTFFGGASEADKDHILKQARAELEAVTRKNYDDALNLLKRAMEERIAKGIISRPSAQQLKMSEDGIRLVFYNKAYAVYACVKNAIELLENIDLKACEAKMSAQLNMNMKLSDYIDAVGDRAAIRCEMQSRLFQEELEFPPFEFLEGARLFDYDKLNACIMSSVR